MKRRHSRSNLPCRLESGAGQPLFLCESLGQVDTSRWRSTRLQHLAGGRIWSPLLHLPFQTFPRGHCPVEESSLFLCVSFEAEENAPPKVAIRPAEFHPRPTPACHTPHPTSPDHSQAACPHPPSASARAASFIGNILSQTSPPGEPLLSLQDPATGHLPSEDFPTLPGRGCCHHLLSPLVPSCPFGLRP